MVTMFAMMVVGFVCAVSAVSLVRRWALRRAFLSMPTRRGSHDVPTPLGGGVAIALVCLGFAGLGVILGEARWSLPVAAYLAAGSMIAMMGYLDDRHNLSARARLTVQAACALAVVSSGAFLPVVELPALGVLTLGAVSGALLAFMWLVWMTNAFNFIDGIDAMSGTQAIVAASGWIVVFLSTGQDALLLALLLAAASLGFLIYNVTPSLIFMGDAGSTFLGFSFAALPLLAAASHHNPRLLVVGVLFVAPALFDATVTLLRRMFNHQNIFEGHRTHFYQRLTRLGYSHMRVSGTYGAISMFGVGCGLFYLAQGASTLGTIAALAPFGAMSILAIGITAAERGWRWQMLLGRMNPGRAMLAGSEPDANSPRGRRA